MSSPVATGLAPLPAATTAAAPSPRLYRAGSVQYTAAGLGRLFAWLLAGELVFTLTDVLEPKLLPLLLRHNGANDAQIAVILGTITAVMQLVVMPPLGYVSDRTRTRWGRRIPYLAAATPFTSLFLVATPWAPRWAVALGVSSALIFGLLAVCYRGAQAASNCMFFGLVRDVVPTSHMGRFLALFRVFGAIGTFIVSFWLVGGAIDHARGIFAGVALLNAVGFLAICTGVREGSYPDVPDRLPPAARPSRWRRAAQAAATFSAESFAHPIYLWTYLIRLCVYAAFALSGFIIFFPRYELGLDLDRIGKLMAWSAAGWIVLAYPVGKLMDRWGALRILSLSLLLITAFYAASFIGVNGPVTFFYSATATGLLFWIVMLAQLKLTQEIFHPDRYSQLAGASTIVQSVGIGLIISPAAGWILQSLRGWHGHMAVPGLGEVSVGPYRLVNLMLAGLYAAAWFGVVRVRSHWRRLGGPAMYAAPL